MQLLRVLAALPLLLFGSCHLLEYKIDVDHPEYTTESGVCVREVLFGDGEPVGTGAAVTIDYLMDLEDGTRLDSSYDRGTSLDFVIGEAPIAGWNEGMLGMKPGGKRELRVPPALAYGEAGIDNLVPPNATLVFLIELLSAAQ
jgi:FKBP-type peptidyl-prolyl cis-trans isomerase